LQVRNRIHSRALWACALVLAATIGFVTPPAAARSTDLAALPANHVPSSPYCGTCHFKPVRSNLNANRRFLSRHDGFNARRPGQERACSQCHTGVVEASHPTGFTPHRSLPSQYPLNARGEMTCTTCHDMNNGGEIRNEAGRSVEEFCESCHSASFFAGMKDSGRSILSSGHLSVDKKPSGTADNYSLQCMTCHMDSASVSDVRVASLRAFSSGGSGTKNHSIGSEYRYFSMQKDYNPASSLSEAILLPDGKVSCLSCHKVYTAKHGEPTVARNLCSECHAL